MTLVHLIAVVCKPLVLVAVSKRATAHLLKDSKVSLKFVIMAEANFAIELDEKKGRVLVAKRTLDQGELILHEKPLGKKCFLII